MLKILSQPYPVASDRKHHFRVAASISIFVTLFLLLFKPFGLANYEREYLTLRIAGYGVITFVTLISIFMISRLIKPIPDEEKWTTGKEILSVLVYIALLGIANVFYTHFAFGLNFSVPAFLNFQLFTLLIGFFPVSFFVFRNHLKLSHQNELAAATMSEEIKRQASIHPASKPVIGDVLHFTSENEKEFLDIHVNDLILIESADNYSTVYFLQNGKVASKILRSSLKRIESQARHENLLRCHRTYIVNLQKVTAVTGNAQGYRLRFDGFDQTFPVSRSLNETIKEKLQHLSKG